MRPVNSAVGCRHAHRRLKELEPVAERIADVEPDHSRQGFIKVRHEAGGVARVRYGPQVINAEGRMGLAGRPKVCFHAKMELDRIVAEPDAPDGECRRLRKLYQAEHRGIERACLVLPAGGHGQLNMIEAEKGHAIQEGMIRAMPTINYLAVIFRLAKWPSVPGPTHNATPPPRGSSFRSLTMRQGCSAPCT